MADPPPGGAPDDAPQHALEDGPPAFVRCSHCSWDPLLDRGTRGCRWFECPYLPPELDVHCPQCYFNFYTWEGNPSCDPETCPHGEEARRAGKRVRQWFGIPALR